MLVQAGFEAAIFNNLETFANSEELGHGKTCCDGVYPPTAPWPLLLSRNQKEQVMFQNHVAWRGGEKNSSFGYL